MIRIHETGIETLNVPGRKLKWLIHPEEKVSSRFSMNVIWIEPGNTVKPAHAHPSEEEVIYIISGKGKVYVEGEVAMIEAGHVVVFPSGHKHMVSNSGKDVMKILCFFTPPADFNQYQYFDEIEFPEE